MEVILLQHAHLEECAALFVSVFNNPPWNEAWAAETARQRLTDCYATPGFVGFLARLDGHAIGFALGFSEAWETGRHFHLKEMCVATAQQRQGVGAALLGELERELKRQGIAKLYLHTARETPAHAFYEKQGYYASSRMIMMARRL